jgi:ribonuclease HI
LSTPRVNRPMEVALSGFHADMYPIVAPLELRAGIALFSPSNLFYTDSSLINGVAGFAVHHSIDCNIGFRMKALASIFTAELAAIHMGMDHIQNKALGTNLILTGRMSLIRAMESQKISLHIHSFVYECKQKCWQLTRSGREVSFMWVPAYVRNVENERVDFEARQATLSNMVYNAQSVARDLLPVAKQRMLEECHSTKFSFFFNIMP